MPKGTDLADRIDDLLPQTQCARCGYDGCRPYAEAIAARAADINRCPPGGDMTIVAIARLLARNAPPLDTGRGTPGPYHVARIDESTCIGCTLCIQACPVDAILGAPKRMHGVLASLCTGCELCIPPCPVDCIDMVPAGRSWTSESARVARTLHEARNTRLAAAAQAAACATETDKRKTAVAAAIARARARRSAYQDRQR